MPAKREEGGESGRFILLAADDVSLGAEKLTRVFTYEEYQITRQLHFVINEYGCAFSFIIGAESGNRGYFSDFSPKTRFGGVYLLGKIGARSKPRGNGNGKREKKRKGVHSGH